jgi:hypothetical protein
MVSVMAVHRVIGRNHAYALHTCFLHFPTYSFRNNLRHRSGTDWPGEIEHYLSYPKHSRRNLYKGANGVNFRNWGMVTHGVLCEHFLGTEHYSSSDICLGSADSME